MKQFRTILALAVMAALTFLGLWALLAVMRYGSCASGGVYVSSRQCAPGTGLKIMGIMGSVFGVLIAMFFLEGHRRAVWGLCGLVSGMLASYFFVIAFGPDLTSPGESPTQTPSLIAAIVFSLLALPGIWGATRPARPSDDPASVFGPDGPGNPAPIVPARIVMFGE